MNICINQSIFPMFFANCHIKVYKFISMKKLTLKLPYTAASYSCWKVAPLDITYSKSNIQDFNRYLNREQNQCKPNSRITPFKRMLFISHTENIPLNLQANLVSSKHSTSAINEPCSPSWSKKNDNDYLLSYMKPVKPSLDDIQIEDFKWGNKNILNKSINTKFSLPCSRLSKEQNFCTEELEEEERIQKESYFPYTLPTPFAANTNMFILYCSTSNQVSSSGSDVAKQQKKPSEEQLSKIYLALSDELSKFFVKPMDYEYYSPNVIFENKFSGTRTVGLGAYISQLLLVRMIAHIMFTSVHFRILKITKHTEDNTIRVRWRIVGNYFLKTPMQILNRKISKSPQEHLDESDKWYDGFSTFYVGEDGRIAKHVADKMMPDRELELVKKPPLATRLASLVGFAPKTSAESPRPAPAVTSANDKAEDGAKTTFSVTTQPLCVI